MQPGLTTSLLESRESFEWCGEDLLAVQIASDAKLGALSLRCLSQDRTAAAHSRPSLVAGQTRRHSRAMNKTCLPPISEPNETRKYI